MDNEDRGRRSTEHRRDPRIDETPRSVTLAVGETSLEADVAVIRSGVLTCLTCDARYVRAFPKRCLWCTAALLPPPLDPDGVDLHRAWDGSRVDPCTVRLEEDATFSGCFDDRLDQRTFHNFPSVVVEAFADIVQPAFDEAIATFNWDSESYVVCVLSFVGFRVLRHDV